jgi:hypothetical protein
MLSRFMKLPFLEHTRNCVENASRLSGAYCTIGQEQIIFSWILSDLSYETGFGKPSPPGSQIWS